jgi:hypothetical protein
MHGEQRNAYIVSVGKPEGMRPLGRPFFFGWEDNIKTEIEDMLAWRGLD